MDSDLEIYIDRRHEIIALWTGDIALQTTDSKGIGYGDKQAEGCAALFHDLELLCETLNGYGITPENPADFARVKNLINERLDRIDSFARRHSDQPIKAVFGDGRFVLEHRSESENPWTLNVPSSRLTRNDNHNSRFSLDHLTILQVRHEIYMAVLRAVLDIGGQFDFSELTERLLTIADEFTSGLPVTERSVG